MDPEDLTLLDRVRAAIDLLETFVADRGLLAGIPAQDRHRLLNAAGAVYVPDTTARRRMVKATIRKRKAEKVKREEGMLSRTGIRTLRRQTVYTTPNVFPPAGFEPHDVLEEEPETRLDPQHCYVCKQPFTHIHHFYDQLCPPCAELNYAKRTELADLRGRVALLTGGRVKIGYQAGIKLLRAGAHLVVTTRFPRDSALRYSQEPDFPEWADRLESFGLDLRHTPSVEAFCQQLVQSRARLDFIINNACQTVRRPPGFYRHMMEVETASLRNMPAPVRRLLGNGDGCPDYRGLFPAHPTITLPSPPPAHGSLLTPFPHASQLSQLGLLPEDRWASMDVFPSGMLDQNLQQVDLRAANSWRLLLAEVSSVELLEVQLVNAIAPFIFNARLKPLMLRTPGREKHIVNVSAMEGQFYRNFKTTRHPHTNMAKAALNMMTRTSATDYQRDGIHMNSVDTGWVTDEDPTEIAARKVAEHRFHPPLDIVDGAARILDPIIAGVNTGRHVWGQFLKDYHPTDW